MATETPQAPEPQEIPDNVYVCQCCRIWLQMALPDGPKPARIMAQCPRCSLGGCTRVQTWLPAKKVQQEQERKHVYVFEADCPGCGETTTVECDTPVEPKIVCKNGCTAIVMKCDRCAYQATIWGNRGPGWIPACPNCGLRAALPTGSDPFSVAIRAQHERFLFARHLVATGRLTEWCDDGTAQE